MANKTIQFKDGSDLIYPTIYRTNVNGSQSITSGTTTSLTNTIAIGKGTWMICAYVSWGISSTSSYNINVLWNGNMQRTVRASMVNGGGAVNTVITAPTVDGTISVSVWQNSGSSATATYWIDAVKLA